MVLLTPRSVLSPSLHILLAARPPPRTSTPVSKHRPCPSSGPTQAGQSTQWCSTPHPCPTRPCLCALPRSPRTIRSPHLHGPPSSPLPCDAAGPSHPGIRYVSVASVLDLCMYHGVTPHTMLVPGPAILGRVAGLAVLPRLPLDAVGAQSARRQAGALVVRRWSWSPRSAFPLLSEGRQRSWVVSRCLAAGCSQRDASLAVGCLRCRIAVSPSTLSSACPSPSPVADKTAVTFLPLRSPSIPQVCSGTLQRDAEAETVLQRQAQLATRRSRVRSVSAAPSPGRRPRD